MFIEFLCFSLAHIDFLMLALIFILIFKIFQWENGTKFEGAKEKTATLLSPIGYNAELLLE